MASLRRFPDSSYWYACYTLPNGCRVQRSTRETKRKDAQKKADKYEELSKSNASARQAQIVVAEIYRAKHHEELPGGTARQYINGWLARRRRELARASHAAYSGRAAHFLDWLGTTADRPLPELDIRHLVTYRDALAERISPSTVNHGIKMLRVIFEDARRDGYIAENPAKDCRPLKKTAGPTRRPFTAGEVRKVLTMAGDEWRSMIIFAFYTGMRLSDVALLTWANIDLPAGVVHRVTGKRRRFVRVPICEALMKHILSLPSGDDPSAALHPVLAKLSKPTLSRQFGDLLAKAGLVPPRKHRAKKVAGKEKGEEGGRNQRRATSVLSFHSLRHSATSELKNAGVSSPIVEDIIGHDSAAINAQYTHIEDAAKRAAMSHMPDVVSPLP